MMNRADEAPVEAASQELIEQARALGYTGTTAGKSAVELKRAALKQCTSLRVDRASGFAIGEYFQAVIDSRRTSPRRTDAAIEDDARARMLERNRVAYRSEGESDDGAAAEHFDATEESPDPETARARMLERNRGMWRK